MCDSSNSFAVKMDNNTGLGKPFLGQNYTAGLARDAAKYPITNPHFSCGFP